MLDDIRKPEAERREWIVEALKDENGMYTGYLHKGELVRCKECKYRYMDADLQVWTCPYGLMIKPDGFCNYGEREGE